MLGVGRYDTIYAQKLWNTRLILQVLWSLILSYGSWSELAHFCNGEKTRAGLVITQLKQARLNPGDYKVVCKAGRRA
jgi:hypothetical protein